MEPMHDGIRKETRTRFIEGEGYLVEEVEVGTTSGQRIMIPASGPREITVADVSMSLARQVCEANGMLVVPSTFLNEQQLADLQIDPASIIAAVEIQEQKEAANSVAHARPEKKLRTAEAIKLISVATTFEELNDITNKNTSVEVMAAAEARAAEIKG